MFKQNLEVSLTKPKSRCVDCAYCYHIAKGMGESRNEVRVTIRQMQMSEEMKYSWDKELEMR